MQLDQSVSEMVEEVFMRQAKAIAQRSGHTLEDTRQAVADSEADRQLRDLTNGEHRHVKTEAWQVGVFWERAEQRFMPFIGWEVLSRFATDR